MKVPARPLADLRQETEAHPQDAKALMPLGVLYLRQNDDDLAIAMFRRATDLDGKFADAWLFLGVALNTKGITAPLRTKRDETGRETVPPPPNDPAALFAEADRAFTRALELNPDDKFAWTVWAAESYKRGINNPLLWPTAEAEPIIDKLDRALAIDPDYALAQNSLAHILKTYSAVYRYLRAAHQQHPNAQLPASPEVIESRAQEYTERYVEVGRRIIDRGSDDQRLYLELGALLTELKRDDDAIAIYQRAAERFPGTSTANQAYSFWGEILQRRGDVEGARDKFRKSGRRMD